MDTPPVRYVTTKDSFNIAYTVCGEGRPFVFMPLPFNHVQLFWNTTGIQRSLYECLAARFKLVCYDGRGQGFSSRGLGEGFRAEDLKVDLEAVVHELQLGRFVLMAQDAFGRAAVAYAAQHPERVFALILWEASTGPGEYDTTAHQLDEVARGNWDLFVETAARVGWVLEEPAVARRFVRESITQSDWLRRAHAWRSQDVAALFRKVRVPTLVIASSPSAYVFSAAETSRYIASRIPGARLAVFDEPGASLYPRGQETPAGVRAIEDFLEDLPPTEDALAPPTRVGAPPDGLTRREVEVLRHIAEGCSNKQIADELVLSIRTVERHINHVYAKIGAHTKAQATAYALREGLASGPGRT